MSFEKYFCSSPWFHMRLLNNGTMDYCRWANTKHDGHEHNIKNRPIELFFQKDLADIRTKLLEGQKIDSCNDCYKMEKHQKISGRQKQLLKTGIDTNNFIKTSLSSPWVSMFKQSLEHNGLTQETPRDWQIDLGNYCNSACVFCHPKSSSRLANEFKVLGLLENLPEKNWTTDDSSLNTFLDFLIKSNNLSYLHFIGGEPVIIPAFKKILCKLVEAGLNKSITIGFTTNLTVWDEDLYSLLKEFRVQVGLSIECLHPVNEYIRYGKNYNETLEILDKWVNNLKGNNWLISMRTTPSLLSVLYLDTMYQYCLKNNVFIESCNFLDEPKFLRPTVLPIEYRQKVLEKINKLLGTFTLTVKDKLINTRNENFCQEQIFQDLVSYKNYLEQEDDESFRLPQTISYLKKLESLRGNSILDYLPEYEELFKSAGY